MDSFHGSFFDILDFIDDFSVVFGKVLFVKDELDSVGGDENGGIFDIFAGFADSWPNTLQEDLFGRRDGDLDEFGSLGELNVGHLIDWDHEVFVHVVSDDFGENQALSNRDSSEGGNLLDFLDWKRSIDKLNA